MKSSHAAWGSVVLAGVLATAACSTSPSEGGGGDGAHLGRSNSAGQGAGAPEGSTGANPSTDATSTGASIATGPLTTSGTGPGATSTGTSTGTGECSGGDPQTCANCCDAAHSEGAMAYQTTLENCACAGACASACAVACQSGGAADQTCLACLEADLNNGACSQEPCASDTDCLALQDCENACDAGGTTTATTTGATTTTTTTTGPSTSSAASTTSGGGTSYEVARVDCVDDINMYRATLSLPPYARWGSNEACTDGQALNDGTVNMAHDAFGQCGEHAQDECPGWPGPPEQMIGQCLAQMWAEGPGTDFNTHGHYINMSSTQYTMVSCGYHVFSDGSVWATQDFQ